MSGEWRDATIGSVCEIYDGPHATPVRREEGLVYLGISNLSHGRIDLSAVDYISEEEFSKWTKRVTPNAGDVVFSYETRLGEAALIPTGLRCCLGRRMGLMRPNVDIVEGRFLLYYYLGPGFQETLRSRTVQGSTVERISLTEFPSFPISLPPLPEQRRIAKILGDLDDKIELNRKMNETLEQMARALFKSWFVDFDPVRAKMEGRTPTGMDAATAALFPDRLIDSELGMIPEGWRINHLSDVSVINALTLAKSDVLQTIEYIEISEVNRGNIARIASYPRGEEPSRARRRLQHGDTVLSTVRPERGCYFLALHPPFNRLVSTGFAVVTPTKVPWSLLHAALTQPEVSDHLGQLADGGAYPAVDTHVIRALELVLPVETTLIEEYHRQCTSFYQLAEINRNQSRTLSTLRDTLLPKLVGGEMRVGGNKR